MQPLKNKDTILGIWFSGPGLGSVDSKTLPSFGPHPWRGVMDRILRGGGYCKLNHKK